MNAGDHLPPILRAELDAYLSCRAPVKLLSELVTMLRRSENLISFLAPTTNTASLVSGAQAAVANAALTPPEDTTAASTPSEEPPAVAIAAPVGKKAKKAAKAAAKAAAAEKAASSATAFMTTAVVAKAAAQQTFAATLTAARSTQALATFGLADAMHYNVELMMNLVVYICITAVKSLREAGLPLNTTTIAHTPQMDIIQSLVLNLDNEGDHFHYLMVFK